MSFPFDIFSLERVMKMLQYQVAKELYNEISEKAELILDDEFLEFYGEFLILACEYAKIRTDWAFLTPGERAEQDAGRSRKHDAYMAMLSAVCRNLKIQGLDNFLPDRKTKGDFACYIALFLSLEQR